jgi:hypothetical protein
VISFNDKRTFGLKGFPLLPPVGIRVKSTIAHHYLAFIWGMGGRYGDEFQIKRFRS